jgi:nitrite reductase/ring-hydroxylating ferredoxin subunit
MPTKIRKILFVALCVFFAACNDEEPPLPYVAVRDVYFNLNMPPYNTGLELPPTALKIKYREKGYNNNGLILVRKSENEFYAYDATCTRNIREEATSLDVTDGGFNAHCSTCKAVYQIQSGAYERGGKYRLQEYRVNYNPGTKTGEITN